MVSRLALAVLVLLLGYEVGLAQSTSNEPIMGSQSLTDAIGEATEESYRILVIGDALAGGLGAGLARMAEPDPRFEIVNRYQETSGIARPEVYDWAASLPLIMEARNFSAVVVLMGSNDRQNIRVGENRLEFNSPEWIAAYKNRTAQILDILKASGAKLFWVALPPMGDGLYDRDMQMIAALQKGEAAGRGAIHIDLRANFLNPDGTYTDTGTDDIGEIRKLRGRNGVEFLRAGNNRFGQLLLAEINREIDTKNRLALPVPVAAGDGPPIFGQLTIDGLNAPFLPDKTRIGEALKVAAMLASNDRIMRTDIIPGTNAEQLFVHGQAPPAPAGRFDDFTMPVAAE